MNKLKRDETIVQYLDAFLGIKIKTPTTSGLAFGTFLKDITFTYSIDYDKRKELDDRLVSLTNSKEEMVMVYETKWSVHIQRSDVTAIIELPYGMIPDMTRFKKKLTYTITGQYSKLEYNKMEIYIKRNKIKEILK